MNDNVRSKINPWERIFRLGIPNDLREPYPNFSLILSKIKENDCKRVLDVAVGSGRHSFLLSKEGFDIFGFDLSASAVNLTRNLFKNHGLNGNFCIADMFEKYPYMDGFFDAVVAIQAIYHGTKDDMVKAVSECARVLRPGGLFIFTVSSSKERASLGATKYEGKKIADRTYMPLVGREKGLIHYYPEKDELEMMLNTHFSNVRILEDNKNKYLLVTVIK